MLKLQGALLWGPGSLCVGVRCYSSARVKEETRKLWLHEQVELLEVLEARLKQLRTDNRLEILKPKIELSEIRKFKYFPQRTAASKMAQNEQISNDKVVRTIESSFWKTKLKTEKLVNTVAHLQRTTSALESILCSHQTPERKNSKLPPESLWESIAHGMEEAPKSSSSASPAASPACGRVPPPVSSAAKASEEDVLKLNQRLLQEMGIHQDDIQMSILAHIDTCLFLSQKKRALQLFLYYHNSLSLKKWLTTQMFSILMCYYAKQNGLEKIGWLFSMLEKNELKPNLDCYMAVLNCMGRMDANPHIISRCIEQLENDGFSLEDFFQDSSYEDIEVVMILKAIQKVKPDFKPDFIPPQTFTMPLLEKFYSQKKPISYTKLNFTVQELQQRFRKQYNLENSDRVTVESVEATKPLTATTVKARATLAKIRSHWRATLLYNLRKLKRQERVWHCNKRDIYPFLCVLKEEEYVDVLMQTVFTLPAHGESLTVLAKELGTRIYNKYTIVRKIQSLSAENFQKTYNSYAQLFAKDNKLNSYLPREYWEKLRVEEGYGPSLTSKQCAWPQSLLIQLGFQLVELLVQTLKFDKRLLPSLPEKSVTPVLYHVYAFRGAKQIGFIKPHGILIRLLQEASETTLTFDSFVIPMLCPPVPWVSSHFGAYSLSPVKLMRCPNEAVQHQLLLGHCPRGCLSPVLDALNYLGNCPWKVNQPVLDLVISIFNDKGSERLGIPPPPSLEARELAKQLAEGSPLSKMAAKWKMVQSRKKAREMYSMRMDMLYKLSLAKHMREEIFWFPHNLDFRGRTYPCPPHFNHLGSDLTRGILLFAEGKPLGPRGLDWLKIHLVNLTGLRKKSSLQDRLAYANEIMPDILDSADNPLTGKKWWMNIDEPWQVLACSMEIAKAVRSPNPDKYVSHFPVHQDGSCNGLQHYAALGRDVVGAVSVNLSPSDVPQDVYSSVALQVEVFREQDAKKGVRIAQVLDGFITRKVVKQTVMTVVYGVTQFGGRLQIEKQLKEIDSFPQADVWEASRYLVQQVFKSLTEMFSGSREIQNWLTESARLISKLGQTVEWVTPLGLPIIQPYHQKKSITVKGDIQNLYLQSGYCVDQKPNTRKQKNAFPPNFIHSLDSSHMMLTALHCQKVGLTFVSVHDCFWTHAATVDVMNKICRKQFVALHKQPILENLSKFMLQKYCSNVPKKKDKELLKELKDLLSKVPPKGAFNLENVKKSPYFFN